MTMVRSNPSSTMARSARLQVAIVIPTRNRGALIAETLQSLMTLDYPGLEILIVDQSTNDATKKAVLDVAKGDPRVRLEPTRTVGSSSARTLGARLCWAETDIIAYIDDDCIPSGGWLGALVAELGDPRISAVMGRLVPHGFSQRTGSEAGFKPTVERQEYFMPTPPWYIGHGGNMAVRRNDLLDLGGFDPLLGAGSVFEAAEDADIMCRLLAAGKRIVYSPDALIYHKEWKPWPGRRKMERAYGIGAGAMFAKQVRCGDLYALRLLAIWIWQLGVRRIGAGLLKWHSLKTMYLGYCQLVYPWVGIWKSLRYPVDRDTKVYVER